MKDWVNRGADGHEAALNPAGPAFPGGRRPRGT